MRLLYIVIGLLISHLALAITVTFQQEPANAITIKLEQGSRINDALEKHNIDENGFLLGAGWYKQKLIAKDEQLKKGILFDLSLAANTHQLNGDQETYTHLMQLHEWISPLTPNGRLIHSLDPAALLATDINHLLDDGDRLVYRQQPNTVHIIGAVTRHCVLHYQPSRPAAFYLDQCIRSDVASLSEVSIIQADGSTHQQGIAPFNRRHQQLIAPGAIIFVPFKNVLLSNADASLQSDIVRFLASQTPIKASPP